MASMNISLPDPMREWVEARIKSGQYASSSDYVRDLIRHDQARRTTLDTLQTAITEGLQSGIAKDFDPDAFEQQMLAKYSGN